MNNNYVDLNVFLRSEDVRSEAGNLFSAHINYKTVKPSS